MTIVSCITGDGNTQFLWLSTLQDLRTAKLHVFGPEVPLSEWQFGAAQHKGLGKMLLREAERIAHKEFQAQHIAILSGVGAREYYRTEFDYSSLADYMVKKL